MWLLQVFPDGPGAYPGVPTNNIKVCFRKAMDSSKTFEIWSEASPGSWQRTGVDYLALRGYWNRPAWWTIGSLGSLVCSKEGLQFYIDRGDLFRVFGGKMIVWDWQRD